MDKLNELKAKEGMYLTQLDEVEDRIYAIAVLGVTATYEYWRDATEEEKIAYEKSVKLKEFRDENI